MKQCTKCRQTQPLNQFYVDQRKNDGKTNWCKTCFAKRYKDNRDHYAKYREENRQALNERTSHIRHRNMSDWNEFFRQTYGDNPVCGACERRLTWNRGNKLDTVHFDHRQGGTESISCIPTKFCEKKSCSLENQKIWLSCNFGVLCNRCNTNLPTQNREEWLRRVNQYVFGSDSITLHAQRTNLADGLDWEL